MIVAELCLTQASFGSAPVFHRVRFDDLSKAKEEYGRIKALLMRRGEKGNDLPRWLEIQDGLDELTADFDHISSLGLVDLAMSEKHAIGMDDAFPVLARKTAQRAV